MPRSTRLLPLLLCAAALVPSPSWAAPAVDGPLVGTFTIDPGSCAGTVTGSYLRMILPTGSPSGPFLENGDSACADTTYTTLTPGSDGGLVTGDYQPAPEPRYDADGHSLAGRINRPVSFFGVRFSTSTNPTDLQSGLPTPAPALHVAGGRVTGDLSSVVATWNEQEFNQGSPKPDGTAPGNTTPVTGTYDAATGRYSIQWTSQIVGGPFDDFTGLWHLEGTFRPAGGAPVPSGGPSTGAAPGPAPAAAVGPTDAPSTADGSPVPATAPPTAADEVAAPVEGDPIVASRDVQREGWRAPTALIVGLAAAGIVAAIVLVRPARRADA